MLNLSLKRPTKRKHHLTAALRNKCIVEVPNSKAVFQLPPFNGPDARGSHEPVWCTPVLYGSGKPAALPALVPKSGWRGVAEGEGVGE
jgi:hypothetical protein